MAIGSAPKRHPKRKESKHIMFLHMLKSKIHRATITDANIDYVGSITIDSELMEQSGIHEFEKVQIADVNNGARLETYVIAGEPGSGCICLNGAAARLCNVGDLVIIMAYGMVDSAEAEGWKPTVVIVDADNKPVKQD